MAKPAYIWDGSSWVSVLGPSVTSIDNLSDVVITSPSTNQILQYDGTNWVNATNATKATNIVGGNGTTLLGSVPYQSNTDTTTLLSPNTTTTRKFLRQTGDGTNGAAPAWDTVTKTDVGLSNVENTALSSWAGSTNITTLGTIASGTWNATQIGAVYGGTGITSYAAGDIIYASAINTLSKLTAGTAGQVLTISGGVPTWATPSSGSGTVTTLTAGTGISFSSGATITTTGTISADTAVVATTSNSLTMSNKTLTSPVIDSISASSASATPSLWSTVTTGTVGIATALTTGTLNIATTGGTSGNTRTVNIGTGGGAGVAADINLGYSGAGTVTVYSPTFIAPGLAWIYGTGADGTVTISSGTTTLTRDMDYLNLTISGTGVLKTNGFKVRVSGTLDISAAAAGSITNNGSNGNNASAQTAGTAVSQPDNQWTTVPKCGMSNAGGNGGSANGSTGTIAASYINYGGANGGQSGAGANGNSGTGGAGNRAGNGITLIYNLEGPLPVVAWNSNNSTPSTAFAGSIGAGGGGGGGSGSGQGGGGGAGGTSGGAIYIAAQTIARGTNTNVGIIQAIGGNGGNGGIGGSTGSPTGGGGGGAGGGGGTVMIVYRNLTGSTISNAIDVTGGNGGNGGAGGSGGTAGAGGGNGGAGNVLIIDSDTGVSSLTRATDGATAQAVGTTAGKTATTTRVSL